MVCGLGPGHGFPVFADPVPAAQPGRSILVFVRFCESSALERGTDVVNVIATIRQNDDAIK